MTKIFSRKCWNKTNYWLEEGKQYRFTTQGTWKDGSLDECDSFGWTKTGNSYKDRLIKIFENFRRMPSANWFSMIGAIEKNKKTFIDIGAMVKNNQVYTATATGYLWCFANDLSIAYINNKGSIFLKIEDL